MAKSKRKQLQQPELTTPDQSPGFDIGFQLPEQANLENGLGNLAINTEALHEAMQSQVETALGKLDGSTKSIQSSLADQLYTQLQQLQQRTNNLQHTVEVGFSGQLGKLLEQTTQIAPTNPSIQAINVAMNPTPPVALPNTTNPNICVNMGPGADCSYLCLLTQSQQDALSIPGTRVYIDPTKVGGRVIWVQRNLAGVGTQTLLIQEKVGTPPMPPQIITLGFCAYPGPDWSQSIGNTNTNQNQNQNQQTQTTPPCVTLCGPIDIKWPDCLKVQDCTPPPPDCPKYCIYCSFDGILYIVKDTQPKRDDRDTKLFCGDILSANIQQLVNQCNKTNDNTNTNTINNQQLQLGGGLGGCDNLFNYQLLTTSMGPTFFRDLLVTEANNDPTLSSTGSSIVDGALIGALGMGREFLGGFLDMLQNSLGSSAILNLGGNAQSGIVMATRILTSMARKWVGDVVRPADTSLEYAQNTANPYLIPSSEAATGAFLTNSISLDRLKCIVAANGNRWDSWGNIVDSQRTKLNPAETLMLWRRRFISKQDRNDGLRQLGYLNQSDYDGLVELTNQVPPISDLISMMIRDVEDTVNVDWTESDRIFADKWKGQLSEWGYNQGVPDLYAKYAWRAHWVIPSPGQLALFWQRLRHTGKFGTEAEFLKLIKGALTQQDILPFWHDAYLETQFHPLTRVDAKRAFALGSINATELEQAFTDAGYSDKNAKVLVDFTQKQLIEQYKRAPILNNYAQGLISYSELDSELRGLGLDSPVVVPILDAAKKKLTYRRRKVCLAAIRKKFLLGETKVAETRQLVIDQGLDADQTDNIMASLLCEQSSKSKYAPAATLCGWYEQGVIDETEFYSRLRNIGFVEDDATKMVRSCMIRNNIRLDKENQRSLAKAQRDQRRLDALQRKLEKKFEQDLQTQTARAQKAINQRTARQKILINLGEAWSIKTGMPLADSVSGFDTIIKKIVASNIAPINLVYTAAQNAAKDPAILTLALASAAMVDLLLGVDAP